MSGLGDLSGLFGTLTTKTNKLLSFRTLDVNKDSVISKEEFRTASILYNCDSVTFSGLDKNSNGEISEEEFAIINKNRRLQTVVDEYKGKIAQDYIGERAVYQQQVIDAIKQFTLDFVTEHTDDDNLVESFRAALLTFYNNLNFDEVTDRGQGNNFSTDIVARVTQKVLNEKLLEPNMSEKVKKALLDRLKELAATYIADNHNLKVSEKDLTEYLVKYMTTSDADRMKASAEKYESAVKNINFEDKEEALNLLKIEVQQFLEEALSQHIILTLGLTKITDASMIKNVLYKYTDAKILKNDMDKLIAGLSKLSEKDKIIAENQDDNTEAAEIARDDSNTKIPSEIQNLLDSVISNSDAYLLLSDLILKDNDLAKLDPGFLNRLNKQVQEIRKKEQRLKLNYST